MRTMFDMICERTELSADGFHFAKDRMAAFHDHRVTVLIEDIGQGVGKLLTLRNGDTEASEQYVSLPEAVYQGLAATNQREEAHA